MARYGINTKNAYGASMPVIRQIAKQIGENHSLSLQLWKSGIHEARILAGIIDNPDEVTEKQMENWVKDFYSWDVCDQVCTNLFDRTGFAVKKVIQWSKRKEEFVKRAGFTIIAGLAVHNKTMTDKEFEKFFHLINKESTDDRNFVRKAVNWALRNIGKRNLNLNKKAIKLAQKLKNSENKTARWIGSDAYRELINKRKSVVVSS